MILISFDGHCEPNPGKGGFGCLIADEKCTRMLSGGTSYTTNNREEWKGLIEGLSFVLEDLGAKNEEIAIFGDSDYVLRSACQWHFSWVRNGWKRKKNGKKDDIKNLDLVQQFHEIGKGHGKKNNRFIFYWVRGHTGFELNEMADRLAQRAPQGAQKLFIDETKNWRCYETGHHDQKKLADFIYPYEPKPKRLVEATLAI